MASQSRSTLKKAPKRTAARTEKPAQKPAGVPGIPFASGPDSRRNSEPGPGRPSNRERQAFREALRTRVLPRLVELLEKSEDGDLILRAIQVFAEIGFNEKLRLAKATAQANSNSNASVQVHLNGGPTGVERPDSAARWN